MTALGAVLLVGAVAGMVRPPRGGPRAAAPVLAVAVAALTGLVTADGAAVAVRPLWPAIAFLLAAVPLAVLLDRTGVFEALAARVAPGPGLLWRAWLLAALVTALLNLDAAVVVLTPLYLRVAGRTGTDRVVLAVIPVLQASLASSPLPVSNLTNLLVEGSRGVGAGAFLVELGPATVAAVGVGWLAFRRWAGARPAAGGAVGEGRAAGATAARAGGSPDAVASARSGTALHMGGWDRTPTGWVTVVGGIVAAACAVGFAGGEAVGVASWQVALGGVAVLTVACRGLPWRALPVDAAALVLALGVLIAAIVPAVALPGGTGPAAQAAGMGAGVVGAAVANNLPALLAVLPGLPLGPGEAGWAYLLGVNAGPVLVLWGSLAALLWVRACAGLGLVVTTAAYHRVGWQVGAPALLAAALIRLSQTALT